MPRPYHSISSVLLGMRCPRAWAHRYIDGLREPEHTWNDPKAPKRSRSTALGKAVHAVLEAWQSGEAPSWRDLPGEIALSGAHLVPHPDRVHEARIEAPIGDVPLPPREGDGPVVAYELHGVTWAGYRDLVVSAPGEFVRLGIDAPDGWALYDYKTTASIDKYALDAAELARDPQASLYAAATCDELGIDEIPARWLYLETKAKRRAQPVDATIYATDAKARLVPFAAKARELDQIVNTADAEMNTGACGEYGGCYYHVSNGGPCNARRSVGSLIQARVRKREVMPLDPTAQSAFSKFKSNGATPPIEAQGTNHEATSGEGGKEETAPVVLPMSGTPVRKPRAAKAQSTGAAGTIAALSVELVEAQAAADAASARVAALLASIKEACG